MGSSMGASRARVSWWCGCSLVCVLRCVVRYEGLEAPMCFPLAYGVDKFKQLLSDNEMMYVPMLFTSGPVCPGVFNGGFDGHSPDGRDVKQHIQVFKEQARAAYDLFPDTTKFCNSHSGNDYFTLAEADEFFGAVLEFQKYATPAANRHPTALTQLAHWQD